MVESGVSTVSWPDSLLNGSEMGRRIREFDWARTPLGPIESWPLSLRAHVGMLVDNPFAMYIFWGPENIALYNDGYIHMAGEKHPRMLGMATEDIWREVWPEVEPLLQRAKSGEPVTIEDLRLTITRRGFPEEFYCAFSYSPLRDETGSIAGALATVTETTARVLTRRRLETLRELASHASSARSEVEALGKIREALEGSADLPFALLYLAHEGGSVARLAARVGDTPPSMAIPDEIPLPDGEDVSGLGAGFDENKGAIVAPIGAHGRQRSIGLLVAGVSPHLEIDDRYREFVTLAAGQIGNSIAAARALLEERARAESLQITRTIEKIGLFAESGQQLFWTTRPDGWIDWYHQSWYDYTGQSDEQAMGWGWMDAHHPDDLEEVMRRWPESLERRMPFEMTFRLRGKDGRYRWFLTRAVPELGESGEVLRWYGTNTNIDSERRSAQQLDFLATLGEHLVQAPDRSGALRALAHALVPNLADWTLINLIDDHGALILSAAHHRDPEQSRLLERFVGSNYDRHRTSSAIDVLKSGKSVLVETATAAIARGRVSDDFADTIETLGMHSVVVVPIVANGAVLGTFHVAATEPDKGYSERDIPFFEEIGRRIGFAIQNADAYEREWRIAHAFQNAALPTALPNVPGLYFSSLYEPASHEAKVGGDFYDAFRLLDGRVVVSIGDVAGAGLEAAATMAALRQSIRAVASVNPDPEMLLRAADGVFADAGRPPFASAFVGVIDPMTFSMQYANAGHPAPVLRGPDGSVTMLEGNDLLLGINLANHPGSRRVGKVIAQPGSLLVLYTDGLTEATRDPMDGEFRLRNAICAMEVSSQTASRAARAIREAVIARRGAAHDDMAVMAVFLSELLLDVSGAGVSRWSFYAEDGATAHAVRNSIVRELREAGVGEEDIFAAQMIYSELVGNVFRHARTKLDVALDRTQEAPVLHVIDSGEGFSLNPKLPADAYAERGRGLYIVTKLAREFTVSPRTVNRGSHARAVLRGSIARSTRGGAAPKTVASPVCAGCNP